MHEHIIAAFVRRNEAEALLAIVKLNGTAFHRLLLSRRVDAPERPASKM
jgi:hypothetical protein